MTCTINNDCMNGEVCIQQICQNPCTVHNPCAQNAACINTAHGVDCSCVEGFQGNGFVGCLPGQLRHIIYNKNIFHSFSTLPSHIEIISPNTPYYTTALTTRFYDFLRNIDDVCITLKWFFSSIVQTRMPIQRRLSAGQTVWPIESSVYKSVCRGLLWR